jgi:hypothetical protein
MHPNRFKDYCTRETDFTMFATPIVVLILFSGCVCANKFNCSTIQCVNEESFSCLEDALIGVNQNLKDLRAAIFQPNMPIPRYTILHYLYLNSMNKSKCSALSAADNCCSDKLENNSCGRNSWVWTRSSVYLLISPGALDYLSFQNIAFLFTAIPRLNKACICLPRLCNDSYKIGFEKQLTSKVYRYLSQPDSLDPSDNLDGNFMEYKGKYRITVPNSFADEQSQFKVDLVYNTRIVLVFGLILYGLVVFPLLSVGVTKVFRVCVLEATEGSIIHWGFLWSSAVVGTFGLGFIVYSDVNFIRNSIQDAVDHHLSMDQYYFFLTLIASVYLIAPGIGHIVIAVRAEKEKDFPLAFPLDVLCSIIAIVSRRTAIAITKVVQGVLLWSFLLFFQITFYRMATVFFAAFSGPLIVWGNFAFILSLSFTISCAVAVPLIFLKMTTETIRKLKISHAKQYIWPLLFSLGSAITAAAVSEVTYIITGLGYYEKHSFSDSFQTVVNFVAQAVIIGLIGYSMKVVLTKMDHATARALNINPVMEDSDDEIHVHAHPAAVILPIFHPRRPQRSYGALHRRNIPSSGPTEYHTPQSEDLTPLSEDHTPLSEDHTPE